MKRCSLLLLLLALLVPAAATTITELEFDSPQQEQRYKSLIRELRCLVCQNQDLADSDADLAKDLRQEVYEMMRAGKSNDEIKAFLVARYGDFVLYRPPVQGNTLLLWIGPGLFLVVGLLGAWAFFRRHRLPAGADDDEELIEEEDA